ncbi:hypothetical protein M0811_02119 [Anaeramoeba ignava]|uniref:Uncharacterized protein n=1 Tax=Anaeramoeba ignava TaxID=1746090 RepID=A0A9Q0R714_ANAIG|nr:hypothetical protein M0811_02119 [Anaeramoeba ignava]
MKKQIKNYYFLFLVHLSSTEETNTDFSFLFENNWEYYYIDNIYKPYFKLSILSNLQKEQKQKQKQKEEEKDLLQIDIKNNWGKIMESILQSSLLSFMKHDQIENAINFIKNEMKDGTILYKKLQNMIEKGKEKGINLYEWDRNKLIQQKHSSSKQKFESFNSFIQLEFRRKVKSILSIFFSQIMVNDNFKIKLNTNEKKEVKIFWENVLEKIKIKPILKIVKYQFNNSKFPFFYQFYSELLITNQNQNQNQNQIQNLMKVQSSFKNLVSEYYKNDNNDLSKYFLKLFL